MYENTRSFHSAIAESSPSKRVAQNFWDLSVFYIEIYMELHSEPSSISDGRIAQLIGCGGNNAAVLGSSPSVTNVFYSLFPKERGGRIPALKRNQFQR